MGERIGVSNEEWALIGPLLPPEHGRGCRPAGDNRRYFEGMMWMARSGAQWRLLPDEYGKWNSVFRRFSRWSRKGVWQRMFEALSDDPDFEYLIVDSTIVRAHQHASGAKKGGLKITPSDARAAG